MLAITLANREGFSLWRNGVEEVKIYVAKHGTSIRVAIEAPQEIIILRHNAGQKKSKPGKD